MDVEKSLETDWEQRYLEQDTPWDKGAPAPPLLSLLQNRLSCFESVLVPGCGRGHDARAIAQRGGVVYGMDLSATALEQARLLDPKGSVQYLQENFLTVRKDQLGEVKTILEHTCFCAIHPSQRSAYRDACMRLLAPGGYWIAILFLYPREEDDPTIGPPYQSRLEEVEALFTPFFQCVDSYIPDQAFAGRQGKEHVMVWQRISD